ncbi:MAG: biotin/lipoyl-binding protein [Deltaproteobacteria bacterium]|nr:biotin/lipoyl-binding protein [Deltaproteobacteria bacterium]
MSEDAEYRVVVHSREERLISLQIDNSRLSFTVTLRGDKWLIHGPGGQIELIELPRFPERDPGGVSGGLTAPMPGKVIATCVSVGDQIEAGKLLLILEAMKMEHRITAPADGVVSELRVQEGDQVANGELLIVLSETEES